MLTSRLALLGAASVRVSRALLGERRMRGWSAVAKVWFNGAEFDVVEQQNDEPALGKISRALTGQGLQTLKVTVDVPSKTIGGYLVVGQYQSFFVAD